MKARCPLSAGARVNSGGTRSALAEMSGILAWPYQVELHPQEERGGRIPAISATAGLKAGRAACVSPRRGPPTDVAVGRAWSRPPPPPPRSRTSAGPVVIGGIAVCLRPPRWSRRGDRIREDQPVSKSSLLNTIRLQTGFDARGERGSQRL